MSRITIPIAIAASRFILQPQWESNLFTAKGFHSAPQQVDH